MLYRYQAQVFTQCCWNKVDDVDLLVESENSNIAFIVAQKHVKNKYNKYGNAISAPMNQTIVEAEFTKGVLDITK